MNDVDELGIGEVETQMTGHPLEVRLGRIESSYTANVTVELFAGVTSRVGTQTVSNEMNIARVQAVVVLL